MKFYDFGAADLTDAGTITEAVDHSWYQYPEGNKELHPWQGKRKLNLNLLVKKKVRDGKASIKMGNILGLKPQNGGEKLQK